MGSRFYDDMEELRRDVETLIDAGRIRFTRHAEDSHPEIPWPDKLQIIRYGHGDRNDRDARPAMPRYICWSRTPTGLLCRGVYCIERVAFGDRVVIITVFPEDGE